MTDSESQLVARTTCSALVITCSDFRFKSAERRFLATAGLSDDYDLIAEPGSIRSLVLPRNASARDIMLEEIRLLWGVHKFGRVLAINHLSCRAYDDLATAETNGRSTRTTCAARARSLRPRSPACARKRTSPYRMHGQIDVVRVI